MLNLPKNEYIYLVDLQCHLPLYKNDSNWKGINTQLGHTFIFDE